jgi:hypothetical protein
VQWPADATLSWTCRQGIRIDELADGQSERVPLQRHER